MPETATASTTDIGADDRSQRGRRTQAQARADAEALGRAVVDRFRAAHEADAASREDAPSWLRTVREEAWQAFAAHGLPVAHDEAWKHTSLKEVAQLPLTFESDPAAAARVDLGTVQRIADEVFGADIPAAACIVTIDGHVSLDLTTRRLLPEGVKVLRLSEALQDDALTSLLQQHLARHAGFSARAAAFVALNTAFLRDAVVVHVERNVALEDPIQVLHLATAAGTQGTVPVHFPRLLGVLEENAEATILQAFSAVDPQTAPRSGATTARMPTAAFTASVTELVAGDAARLHHVKLQEERSDVRHVGPVHCAVGRDATVHDHTLGFGALWARNETHACIQAEGGTAILDGLYLASGHQHMDHHTVIEHQAPHGTSRETYKGVLDGHASAAFLGLIKVNEGAAKTDSEQENRNLLLSDHALANSTPQLEIYNDDVKCAHGSTVGRLDEDAVFFLRTRGIDEAVARRMMTEAFAGEVIADLPHAPLVEHLTLRVRRWFDEDRQTD